MKQLNETLFTAVTLCFSALLLVMTLLTGIKLAAVNDAAARLEQETARLRTQNGILEAEYENSLSLEEIERYAEEVLGMQRCTPEQMIYIQMEDGK
ncbi:MAG: hypothetical protein VB039_04425 [Oscillospiraceae bacterium]|nr:hypothetical protein [Oscillospiraceae bacterium]